MSGKAARIVLSETQEQILQWMVRSTTVLQRLVQRASVILLAFAKNSNEDIAARVELNRKQVGLWRRRWRDSFDALVSIECREPHAKLRRAIEDVLNDAPRSGAAGVVTSFQFFNPTGEYCSRRQGSSVFFLLPHQDFSRATVCGPTSAAPVHHAICTPTKSAPASAAF